MTGGLSFRRQMGPSTTLQPLDKSLTRLNLICASGDYLSSVPLGANAGKSTMKWMTLKDAAALCIAAAFTMLAAAPAYAEKRVALVIGNNDYKNVPKLQKAVNDARTMGDTLKQLGFTVMVAENQTRQAFSQSLLAFDKAVDKGDTAFFFYAGHRFEIDGQNFLMPTDVPAATDSQESLVVT